MSHMWVLSQQEKLFRYWYGFCIDQERISIEEAAAIVGISGRRVRFLVAEGRLPAQRIGLRVLSLLRSDVVAFVALERRSGRPRKGVDIERKRTRFPP